MSTFVTSPHLPPDARITKRGRTVALFMPAAPGPRVGPASVPNRVSITLHGAGEAPDDAFLNRSTCSLTAAGFSVAEMFLSELNAGATWAARGVAGKAVVGVQARHGLPPKRAEEGS